MKRSGLFAIICLATAALLLAACSKEEMAEAGTTLSDGAYPLEIGSVSITAEVDEDALTRVSESSDGASSVFEEGDEITVQLGDETAVYTIDAENNLTAESPLYWKNTLDATVNALYLSPSSETDGSVSLADQSAGLAYVISATATGNYKSSVSLTFSHQLAKVRVTLSGTAASGITSVEIYSSTSCSFDPTTQTLTASDEQDYIPMKQCTYSEEDAEFTCWEANVVPGEISSGAIIRLNSSTIVSLSGITSLEAGKVHVVDVAIYNEGETLVSTADELSAAVATGGTITLTANIELTETLSVSASNVTINLNGYSITSTGSSSSYVLEVGSGSSLTINGNDNASSAVGNSSSMSCIYVSDGGSLSISGGTFSGDVMGYGGTTTISGGTFDSIACKGGTITISGGEFYSVTSSIGEITISDGTFTNGGSCSGFGTLKISGGEFEGELYCEEDGTIEISGGEFSGNIICTGLSGYTANITITGGTFTGSLTCSSIDDGTATIKIYGGTFYNTSFESYLATDYTYDTLTDDNQQTYYVVKQE